jgi:AraC-like DNA-binding protein
MAIAHEPPPPRRSPDERLEDAVRKALYAGLTWEQIGVQLGVSRSDARRQFRRRLGVNRHRQ